MIALYTSRTVAISAPTACKLNCVLWKWQHCRLLFSLDAVVTSAIGCTTKIVVVAGMSTFILVRVLLLKSYMCALHSSVVVTVGTVAVVVCVCWKWNQHAREYWWTAVCEVYNIALLLPLDERHLVSQQRYITMAILHHLASMCILYEFMNKMFTMCCREFFTHLVIFTYMYKY